MAQIAVIVPVYKVEAFIHRCVDSILTQTFSDLALVLVDDGSPDGCPEICDGYAWQDPRVHVIHQKNSGPSAARNAGIDWALAHTECEYLSFVDSDDCIHPSYFACLHEAARATGTGAAMCVHRYINQYETLENSHQPISVSPRAMSAETLMVERSDCFNYPWGKLFSRACFKELRYPLDVSFGEDNLVIYRALFACGTVAFVDEKLYYYFYNAQGITKSPWSERSLQVFLGIEAQLAYYKANGFERAWHKEMELYIQQCAYQIHRMGENRGNHKVHLLAMRRKMKQLLRENHGFRAWDNPYWFEAAYPGLGTLRNLAARVRRNGILGTARKIAKKCFPCK